jgi:hypothetical protein
MSKEYVTNGYVKLTHSEISLILISFVCLLTFQHYFHLCETVSGYLQLMRQERAEFIFTDIIKHRRWLRAKEGAFEQTTSFSA